MATARFARRCGRSRRSSWRRRGSCCRRGCWRGVRLRQWCSRVKSTLDSRAIHALCEQRLPLSNIAPLAMSQGQGCPNPDDRTAGREQYARHTRSRHTIAHIRAVFEPVSQIEIGVRIAAGAEIYKAVGGPSSSCLDTGYTLDQRQTACPTCCNYPVATAATVAVASPASSSRPAPASASTAPAPTSDSDPSSVSALPPSRKAGPPAAASAAAAGEADSGAYR